LGPSFEF